MVVKIYQVDAFTKRPLGGNPAAVCILTGPRDVAWMQNVAKERIFYDFLIFTMRHLIT